MLDIATSKESVRCYIERGEGDGGAVVCYLKEIAPNEYAAHREWFSDPNQAEVEFESIDAQKAELKSPQILTKG